MHAKILQNYASYKKTQFTIKKRESCKINLLRFSKIESHHFFTRR